MTDDRAPARLEQLMSALALGDADRVRAAVGSLLDLGDDLALGEAAERAERHLFPAAEELLDEAVQEEAQRADVDGGEALLFCLPLLLDPAEAGAMPTAAIRELLAARAGPGERFVLVDGWVRLRDLLLLDPIGYRRLARNLARRSARGAAAVAPPLPGLPRAGGDGPDVPDGFEEAAPGRGVARPRRIAVRLAVGLLVRARDSGEGGLADLATGDLGDEALMALASAVEAAVPGVRALLEPGPPIDAAVGAAGALEAMILDARLEAARVELGFKPVSHLCADGEMLRLVMTADGARVVDALEIRAVGTDAERMGQIIAAGSRAMVEHRDPTSLPRIPAARMH